MTTTYTFTAFTEDEILGADTGRSIGKGDVFEMPESGNALFVVVDNDGTLSGDRRDNATDNSYQTADIEVDGVQVGADIKIYAECYHVLRGSDGRYYYMIEIEGEDHNAPGAGDDYFTFYGSVPPAGVTLTVCSVRNLCKGVNYVCLEGPEIVNVLEDQDEFSIVEEDAGLTSLTNVLYNALDPETAAPSVYAVGDGNAGPMTGNVGQDVSGSNGGLFTIEADGSVTFNTNGAFDFLAAGQSTTTSITYCVTDPGGKIVESTYTVEITGADDAPMIEALNDVYDVGEAEGAGDVEGNVLANDDLPFSDENLVVEINGASGAVGTWISLAGGGRVMVLADGTLDFDANGAYDALNNGDTATETLTYTVRSADSSEEALVTIFNGPNDLVARAVVAELNGALVITVEVLSDGGDIGDLRGLFFDVGDEGLLSGLIVTGADVTDSAFDANAVSNLGGGSNVNGEILNAYGAFDGVVEIGTQGMGSDDIRATTFNLSHASQALTLGLLSGQDMAVRLTSVGPEGGNRCDSLKLGGVATESSSEALLDSATVTINIHGEGVEIDAIDDAYSVAETEDVSANILANDLYDGQPASAAGVTVVSLASSGGTLAPSAAVGAAFEITTLGGRAGTVTIAEDGRFLFDGAENFIDLDEGETDSFLLDYTIAYSTIADDYHCYSFGGHGAGTVMNTQLEGVTISAARSGDTSGTNAAMIFDSNNPTGGDNDLGVGRGKILIISEDDDGSDPDDNAQGGTFSFDFANPSLVGSLVFIDTEEPTPPQITLFDTEGAVITTMAGPITGDSQWQKLDIDVDGVSRMEITLNGSGALDDLIFTEHEGEIVTDTATVLVTINGEGQPNLLPMAQDDVVITDERTVSTPINLLTNDDEGDGPATIVAIDGGAPDGNPFGVVTNDGRTAMVTVLANGTLSVDPGSEFLTLAQDETRSFVLSYTIKDANGDQSSANVTITVNGLNEPPVATDNTYASMPSTVQVSGNLITEDTGAGVDSDPNAEALTLTDIEGGSVGTAFSVMTAGGLTGQLLASVDGFFTFDLDAGQVLPAHQSDVVTVAYTVSDIHGASDSAKLQITLSDPNAPPDATNNVYAITDGDTVNGNLMTEDTGAGVDTDPEGDTLTVTGVSGGVIGGSGFAVTTAEGRQGTVIVDADGAFSFALDAGAPALTNGQTDALGLTYTIDDGFGGTDTAAVTITMDSNGAPSFGAVNIAIVVDVSSSMYSDQGSISFPMSDYNGDGRSNQAIDLVHYGLTGFLDEIADWQLANASTVVNTGFVAFSDMASGFSMVDPLSATAVADAFTAAGAVTEGGNSNFDAGLIEADAFFDTLAGSADKNFVFFLSDGDAAAGNYDAISDALGADHGAVISGAYVGPASGGNYAALDLVDNTPDAFGYNADLANNQTAIDAVLDTSIFSI